VGEAIYDSSRAAPALRQLGTNAWQSRGLVRLLTVRELTGRYQRSVLGVWWSLLNPLLEMLVLWLVFSRVFRFSTPHAPYVVYLLSGIVLITLFRETLMGVAVSLIHNDPLLANIYVPAELFPLSTTAANLANFLLSSVPLVAIMLIAGVSLPLTLPAMVVPALCVAAFAAGIGLALAPFVVTYPDIQNLLRIAITLFSYLAPVFYPFTIVPDRFQGLFQLNPLYHFLAVFRAVLYGDSASWVSYAVMVGSAVVVLLAGALVFKRYARAAVAAL
jgi:ABC-2 type transport system permease protein